MSDQALDWIVNALHLNIKKNDRQFVWCTDENALNGLPSLPHSNLQVITNRWDIAEQAKSRQLQIQFSDFDFNHQGDCTLDGFFYRVSKEKPLVHHLLNHAWRCLKIGGELWLSGFKNDGTKTYIEKIAALLGCEKSIKKNGQVYSAQLTKHAHFDSQQQLDTNDYDLIRPISTHSGLNLVSKPGLFGWNKIDAGSAFLIAQLDKVFANRPAPQTCLDLGCGYGYLSIATANHKIAAGITRWVLTDNNAAALQIARENLRINQIDGQVVGADAGSGLQTKADLLLCNPPFHQGFSVDGDLTDKFLANARRLLAPNGIAIFVVNQFIPLERKAASLFRQIKPLADNGSFKVIGLSL
ncbi:methyltransferase [Cellvibrio mixtus]|uniref:methyltransferase n=1 Tax=Cellvibrio mixtus TaxID=39650 RepID=UPI000587DA57|nr:methyltransferase [Cellvibrio mixtus]